MKATIVVPFWRSAPWFPAGDGHCPTNHLSSSSDRRDDNPPDALALSQRVEAVRLTGLRRRYDEAGLHDDTREALTGILTENTSTNRIYQRASQFLFGELCSIILT